jgi:Fe2+ or Zn2+ uptake regulation protein
MSLNDFDDSDSTACKQRPKKPQPPTELTGFQRDLLVVIERLNDSRPTGVEIRQHLEQYHDPEISPGRLYQNLRKLIEEGCVEKRALDGRTNMYRLTETGRVRMSVYGEWVANCFEDSAPAVTESEKR